MRFKQGDRIRIGRGNRSMATSVGKRGWVDHEVDELFHVHQERAYSVRLDDHTSHLQFESELEPEESK